MSRLFLRIAAVYLIVGASLGLYMGATQNFTLIPVHAHILLAGWLSLAVMGMIYHLYPACAETRLAKAHFWLHNVGLPIFMTGLGLMLTGTAALMWLVGVGAATFLLGLICFSINLWRTIGTQ